MDFVRLDALHHRNLSAGRLARQIARVDWGRLRMLAESAREFFTETRRKIRFGDPERPAPPKPPAPARLSPEAIRERMLAARAAQPAPRLSFDDDPGFVMRP